MVIGEDVYGSNFYGIVVGVISEVFYGSMAVSVEIFYGSMAV
jgi:hypothetical protein